MTTQNEAAERLRDDPAHLAGEVLLACAEHRAMGDLLIRLRAAERRATVERHVALLDALIAHPRNEPRYRAAYAGLKVARRAILDEEAAR